jgi:hypothetical protein
MASLDDLLTASKNIVVALNNNAQTNLTIQGTKSAVSLSANTAVSSGAGRLVNVIVTVAGTGAGSIFDAASIALAGTTNKIYVIPNTIGVYTVNIPIFNGIIVEPGTGQTVTVTYS